MTAVELKFNCFFLMPLIDTFPTRLREELEAAYDEDLDEVCARGFRLRSHVHTIQAQIARAVCVLSSAQPAARRV